ncbi:MAG: c-type cytochrome [Gammaproteobacteria bacterium]
MKKINSRWVLGMVASALACQAPVFAQSNAEAGAVKFESCVGCHSKPGYANAVPRFQVPKLGGQQAAYLLVALKAYSSGERPHPGMRGNAEGLNEQDMQDIAAYLAGLKLDGNDDNVGGNAALGKEKAALCAACHGEDGNSSDANFPRLAGQYQSYLIKALEDYRSGKRNNPMMVGMVKELSDADLENISAFYASQGKGLSVVER